MRIQQTRRRRGFTFLEIMFVVVIIGVLLAIAVPKLTGKGEKARQMATSAAIRNVGVSLKEYELHVGSFPTTSQGLEALVTRPSDVAEDAWEGPYMDSVPKDAWKRDLHYKSPGDHNKDYDLWSAGGNSKEGDDDDVTSWVKTTK